MIGSRSLFLLPALAACSGSVSTVDGSATDGPTPPFTCQPTRWATVDAAGGGDGSTTMPWTLPEAMAQAVAGDVVEVGPGVYVAAATGLRYQPAWMAANSGTETSPLVFCARHAAVHSASERSELRNDATAPESGSPTFGTLSQDYVIWDGFYVNEAVSPSASDTGPVTVWDSRNVTISRSVIEGATIARADNHTGIRLEVTANVRLVNNRISGVKEAAEPSQNHAAIQTYDSSYAIIEHNEIFDCDVGIFPKGDHADDGYPNGAFTIRHNHIYDTRVESFKVLGVIDLGTPTVISHNLSVNGGVGGVIFTNVGTNHPAAVQVHNNTFVNPGPGAMMLFANTMHDVTLTDNLIAGGQVIYSGWDQATLDTVKSNGFSMASNFGTPAVDWAVSEADWNYDLAGWQSFSALDGGSSTGDPMFVGAGDYRLSMGSPARTASSTGGPVGCYVTGSEIIGIEP